MKRLVIAFALVAVACAQELRVPENLVANTPATITTTGSGSATLYLFGPVTASKREVKLGEAVTISADELRDSGRYTAVLGKAAHTFFVAPAAPAALNFLARPSRVPVAQPNVISGVAFVFDDYRNLITEPATAKFALSVGDTAATRDVPTRFGIAYLSMDSAKKAGAAQFVASAGSASVRRVVQQVPSDPCNLRFKASPSKNGILVETDPVHDCSGNPVPDGTIVTFTSVEGATRSTVDARIKRGIARAELPAAQSATISAASGVVLGNELHWGGR